MTADICPAPAIKAKGHAGTLGQGLTISGTQALPFVAPSPILSRPLSHSCNFARERPLGHWPQATACPWQALGDIHQPSYSFAPPPATPCSMPFPLFTPRSQQVIPINQTEAMQGILLYPLVPVAQNTHEGRTNSLSRSGPTHLLVSWPQIPKTGPISHSLSSLPNHLASISPSSSGSETVSLSKWETPWLQAHNAHNSLHNQACLLASTRVASTREPALHSL